MAREKITLLLQIPCMLESDDEDFYKILLPDNFIKISEEQGKHVIVFNKEPNIYFTDGGESNEKS